MEYQLYALALIILMLGLAAVRRCSMYSPLVISASVWLVVFTVGFLLQERLYPLQEKAFFAWMIWFMITSLIYFLLYPSRVKSAWTVNEIRRIPLNYTLPLLLMIVWLAYSIWVVGSLGPDQFFHNLRASATNMEGSIALGLVARVYPLVFALFLFENVYAHRENRHLRLLLWCFMLLHALSSMSKIAVLTPILSWVVIQGIQGRMKVKRIFVVATVASALMIAVHFIRASDQSTIMDILALYIYSPLVAMGYVDFDSTQPLGAHVFRFFYAVGNYLGIAPAPVSTSFPFIWVPVPTNAFTVIYSFYNDFGMLGILLGAVFYGLFFSCLYWLSVKNGRWGGWGLVLFSGYSAIFIMQFLGELLIINLSGNLQFLIYAFVVFLASRRIYYVH